MSTFTLYVIFMTAALLTFIYSMLALTFPGIPERIAHERAWIAYRWHIMTMSRDYLTDMVVSYNSMRTERDDIRARFNHEADRYEREALALRPNTIFNPVHLEQLRDASSPTEIFNRALHYGENQLALMMLAISDFTR